MALPDNMIGEVARQIAPMLQSGRCCYPAMPRHPTGGPSKDVRPHLLRRPSLSSAVFNDETEWDARRDYHGASPSSRCMCADARTGGAYALVRNCKAMWSPIINSYRVRWSSLASWEPGLSEMVAMPFVDTMVEAVEECEKKYGIRASRARFPDRPPECRDRHVV